MAVCDDPTANQEYNHGDVNVEATILAAKLADMDVPTSRADAIVEIAVENDVYDLGVLADSFPRVLLLLAGIEEGEHGSWTAACIAQPPCLSDQSTVQRIYSQLLSKVSVYYPDWQSVGCAVHVRSPMLASFGHSQLY